MLGEKEVVRVGLVAGEEVDVVGGDERPPGGHPRQIVESQHGTAAGMWSA